MTGAPDWLIGRPTDEIPTPALVLDLDAFDHNARTIVDTLTARGVTWRPHAKAHGSPILVRRQEELGAIGATCATVTEAIVLVEGRVSSVLVANELASPRKASQVAALQRAAEVIVCVDSPAGCGLLAEAASAAGTVIPVMIEVDIGMARAGVVPGPGVSELAARIASSAHLRLAGVMGYEGHTLDLTPGSRRSGPSRTPSGGSWWPATSSRPPACPSRSSPVAGPGRLSSRRRSRV